MLNRTFATSAHLGLLNNYFLKLDQTSPQTTIGTFTFPTVHTPTINGGILANDDITIQGTTHSTRTSSYVLLQPNGGNVGINTSAPLTKLHVVGTGTFDGGSQSGVAVYAIGRLGINIALPQYGIDASIQGVNFGGDIGSYNTRTDLTNKAGFFSVPVYATSNSPVLLLASINTSTSSDVYFGGSSGSYTAANKLHFYTGANVNDATGVERMTIISSGYVGIGITAPTSTLHVVGKQTLDSGSLTDQAEYIRGRVGINVTTPSEALDVWGKIKGNFKGNGQEVSSIRANMVEMFKDSEVPRRTISATAPINPTFADIWIDTN